MHFSVVECENFSALKEQAFFFKMNKGSRKDVKCAKYKSPRWGGKVREIKFPHDITNENFEKMKINFVFLF